MTDLASRPVRPATTATPEPLEGPIRALLPLALTQKRILGWTILAGLCYHGAAVTAAVTGAALVGLAATRHGAGELVPLLGLLGGSVIAAAAARWWQMWVAHDFAYRLLAELRVRAFDALARIAPRFLLGRRTGELAGTVMSDVEVTERFYAHTLADYVVAVLITVAAVAGLGVLDPLLAAALVPFAIAVATVPYWLGVRASAQGGERGAQLSGGQRQRIAIARALLKDAPVLLMDEAVSSLDAANEQALQAAMAQLALGRTTLIIAHRLSTIRSADRIVVLQAGRVVQTGTHTELLATGGAYADLIATQRGGIVGV